jgi:hypothetical protein
MTTITRPGFGWTYKAGDWVGRSGKASWDPQAGPAYPTILPVGTFPLRPSRPRLMMDPSDPSTWQRQYVFTH